MIFRVQRIGFIYRNNQVQNSHDPTFNLTKILQKLKQTIAARLDQVVLCVQCMCVLIQLFIYPGDLVTEMRSPILESDRGFRQEY